MNLLNGKSSTVCFASGLLWLTVVIAATVSGFADTVTTNDRTVTKLADGIYEIRHKDSPDENVNGNTTVVIGEKEVFVVDSCFQLPVAREDIAQIRQWTNKPVRYLLNTHFHNDHNMGNGVYMAAFPGMDVVAQVETNKDMFRNSTTPSRFVHYVEVRKQRLESGKGTDGKPLTAEQSADLARSLAGKREVLEELKDFVYQPPTLTFDDEFDVDLGNREVQVKHLGRGTTSGDTVVYLPKEKILIAGDLITHPVLFTYDGYPSDWIQTLDRIKQLEIETIVPGHGEILYDKTYVSLCQDLLRSAIEQVTDQIHRLSATAENPTLEDVRKGVDLSPFRERFAGNNKDNIETFDSATAALVRVIYGHAMLR